MRGSGPGCRHGRRRGEGDARGGRKGRLRAGNGAEGRRGLQARVRGFERADGVAVRRDERQCRHGGVEGPPEVRRGLHGDRPLHASPARRIRVFRFRMERKRKPALRPKGVVPGSSSAADRQDRDLQAAIRRRGLQAPLGEDGAGAEGQFERGDLPCVQLHRGDGRGFRFALSRHARRGPAERPRGVPRLQRQALRRSRSRRGARARDDGKLATAADGTRPP